MRVTSDALIQVIEVDRNGCLAFREQRLQFSHSHRIVLGVVECEVADLKKILRCEQIDIARKPYLECDIGPIK
jgi:hypothetical protein